MAKQLLDPNKKVMKVLVNEFLFYIIQSCILSSSMNKNYSIFYSDDEESVHSGYLNLEVDSLFDILDCESHDPPKSKELSSTAETLKSTEEYSDIHQEEILVKRSKTQIEVKHPKPRKKMTEDKTLNLNKFVHKETVIYLRHLQQCKLLSEGEILAVEKFESAGTSFNARFEMYGEHPRLKQKCIEFYKSSSFVQRIMTSRIKFDRKINIIRYLEKIRKSCFSPNQKKWDDS